MVGWRQLRWGRLLTVVAALAAAAVTVVPARALAEVGGPGAPTVQAVAADATWLAYTPPPAQPGIVCMVDSGVDPNPDTEAAVIGGQAIAPETDTLDEIARLDPRVEPGNHPDGHGTLMAMLMAAPNNGWGMVGLAPTSVRVYNMKALPAGQVTFPFAYYAVAIEECRQAAASLHTSMSVVNLSLGGELSPTQTEISRLGNYITAANETGLNVVAAAGNEGAPVLYPAAYPPVLAVGAGDAGAAAGTLCGFASRGEGLDVIAPGCDSATGGLDEVFEDDGVAAYGSGSSQASALVSATLASMRAYGPGLTWSRAQECLTSTAVNGSINVSAAFTACGLGEVVKEGEANEHDALASLDPRPVVDAVVASSTTAGSASKGLPSHPRSAGVVASRRCCTGPEARPRRDGIGANARLRCAARRGVRSGSPRGRRLRCVRRGGRAHR